MSAQVRAQNVLAQFCWRRPFGNLLDYADGIAWRHVEMGKGLSLRPNYNCQRLTADLVPWQDRRMRWRRLSRAGRRTIGVPAVPSMTDVDGAPPGGPQPPNARAGGTDRPPIDRAAVQYLDSVRAIFRPSHRDRLAPGLEQFIGREDLFRHLGMASDGTQAMMQCPVHWPSNVKWVPIGDLEILEILKDQDVRAG